MSRRDGNIAFKVAYNDQGWRRVCSPEAFRFNVEEKKVPWCSIQAERPMNCQSPMYRGRSLSLELYPCYDAIAAAEYFFSPGWNHGQTGERHMCRDAREGKVALLTSRAPGSSEADRFIFGIIDIGRIGDDNPEGAQHFHGDRRTSVILDPTAYVKFWDHYSNAKSSSVVMWGSGLFRYLNDDVVRNVLDAVIATRSCSPENSKRLHELRSRY